MQENEKAGYGLVRSQLSYFLNFMEEFNSRIAATRKQMEARTVKMFLELMATGSIKKNAIKKQIQLLVWFGFFCIFLKTSGIHLIC